MNLKSSFRQLITSHKTDNQELVLSWGEIVLLFTPHFTARLLSKQFSVVDIQLMLSEARLKYNPLLDELLQEMIADIPNPGKVIPLKYQGRNWLAALHRMETNDGVCLRMRLKAQ